MLETLDHTIRIGSTPTFLYVYNIPISHYIKGYILHQASLAVTFKVNSLTSHHSQVTHS